MRTRRSWRNQNRLWKMLVNGCVNDPVQPPTPKPKPVKLTAEEIDGMWWVSKTSRNLMKRDLLKG